MKIFFENKLAKKDYSSLLQRQSQRKNETISVVQDLCIDIKKHGDKAVRKYGKMFDNTDIQTFRVSKEESESAKRSLSPEFIDALKVASKNIRIFHEAQKNHRFQIETSQGVLCWREARPIERIGLYVPAGSAPLPSTVLMLGIPAIVAGCSQIRLCSSPKANGSIDPLVLATATILGITEVYKVGGAQAIAAMAYGTESIPKVDKIFGPGNRFVTAAKQFVSTDPDGVAIDLLAGPSEVLIIADDSAKADVVAYDLISQAEHDEDAQAVLVTTSKSLADEVMQILPQLLSKFTRSKIIEESLKTSFILVTNSLEASLKFSNEYAPEHLIINVRNAKSVVKSIINAGSVFIGPFAPVTAGDYASGTNHTLPTSGTARWASGVSLDSFQKHITFQSITKAGLENLSSTLMTFAKSEGLDAHAKAVASRISYK